MSEMSNEIMNSASAARRSIQLLAQEENQTPSEFAEMCKEMNLDELIAEIGTQTSNYRYVLEIENLEDNDEAARRRAIAPDSPNTVIAKIVLAAEILKKKMTSAKITSSSKKSPRKKGFQPKRRM